MVSKETTSLILLEIINYCEFKKIPSMLLISFCSNEIISLSGKFFFYSSQIPQFSYSFLSLEWYEKATLLHN
jgi:hypothetical protein